MYVVRITQYIWSFNRGAQLPLAFAVGPYLPDTCLGSFGMLGFGDIVIPGLLIAYAYRFQLIAGCRVKYFIVAFAGTNIQCFRLDHTLCKPFIIITQKSKKYNK